VKKFKFNLDSVHQVRELRQEKEQSVLAQLQQIAAVAEERLNDLKQRRTNALVSYSESMSSGRPLDPRELEMHSRHITALDRLREEAERVVEEKRLACRGQVQVLAEAAREVKVTSKLRAKKKAVYDLETAKSEQNALDEITSAKYARQAGEQNL